MADNETIKHLDVTKNYLRYFFIYGFYARRDFAKLGALRSYDNERQRIEVWYGDNLKSRMDGKEKVYSIDAERGVAHNPFYEAFKAKSVTAKSFLVHFLVLDALADYNYRERYDEALEVINKYIDSNSDNAEFYLNRAICYSEGSTHDYRKAFADTIIGFVKYGDSRENLVSSKPERIMGLCNLLIQCLYIYSIRVKELNAFAPAFLETARQLVLSHNIFGKTKEIYMPSENGRIALWDERAFDRNIIGFMKNSKYELNKDLESGCRLAIQAIQYLYTDISVEEKIEEVFIKWSPEASDEDLRNMSYFFPADVLAYTMFIKAALQGFYPAWRYIGSLYANDSFSFYNAKLAVEFYNIYNKAAKEDSINGKKIRELEITVEQHAKHCIFI